VNTYSCDEYIRKNGDELLAAIPHSKAIVLLHTDRQVNYSRLAGLFSVKLGN